MLILADTCTLIWLLDSPEALSATALRTLGDPGHRFLLSAASLVEVAGLGLKGKLRLDFDAVRRGAATLNFEELPVTGRTAERVSRLPRHHSDPFDRILVAEAQLSGAAIVTPDHRIAAYDVQVIW